VRGQVTQRSFDEALAPVALPGSQRSLYPLQWQFRVGEPASWKPGSVSQVSPQRHSAQHHRRRQRRHAAHQGAYCFGIGYRAQRWSGHLGSLSLAPVNLAPLNPNALNLAPLSVIPLWGNLRVE